jgi:6-pyruvoyltetrahydropterin/6-carboxytetrahydropterin synthase
VAEVQSIRIRHNMEMAHRLVLTPGKCRQIHGHSWKVTLTITGEPSSTTGVLVEFGEAKTAFRGYLDRQFDHQILLNQADPISRLMLPGQRTILGDPTTENVARMIYEWAEGQFGPRLRYQVEVWETDVNCATYPAFGEPERYAGGRKVAKNTSEAVGR